MLEMIFFKSVLLFFCCCILLQHLHSYAANHKELFFSKWWCDCWKWLIAFTNRYLQVDAVLFVAAHCCSICKSILKIIKVIIFPMKVVANNPKKASKRMHYIIGVFSATGIRGFTYSICNLDMNICISTTLALKKVSSCPIFTIKQSNSTPVHWLCEKEIQGCIVVFDGYSGASTKDMTHRQWAKGKRGSTVSFILEMCLTIT